MNNLSITKNAARTRQAARKAGIYIAHRNTGYGDVHLQEQEEPDTM